MRYNETIDYEVTEDIASDAEPVTLDELKSHLNLLFETSGSYEFTDDDQYLTDLIPVARQLLEKETGLSFGEKTIIAILRNELGDIEIPFGPVNSVASIKNNTGDAVDYTLTGRKFKKISSPDYCSLEVEYEAGYEYGALPAPLKRAVLEQCAFMYNNRGDQNAPNLCMSARELITPYKRTSWLV